MAINEYFDVTWADVRESVTHYFNAELFSEEENENGWYFKFSLDNY